MTDDLAKIYIRAHVDGRWQSHSIRELLDGHAGAIGTWFLTTCLDAVGMKEGQIVTEADAEMMVAFVETHIRPLVRLEDADEVGA